MDHGHECECPRCFIRPGLINYAHPNDGYVPPGRPPFKYTKALHDAICRYVRDGHHPETAAEMSGLTAADFREWMQRGRDGDPYLVEFAEQVDNAGAWAEADIASKVYEAAKTDPAIGLKWLERQRPKKWNKQVDVILQSEVTRLMNLLEARMTPKGYLEVLRVLSEASGSGEAPRS